MVEDIGPILKKWNYNAKDLNVRIVDGLDGKQKLQMRLDLGILQMELDGRPDGKKPHRCDSYLTYLEKKSRNIEFNSTDGNLYHLSATDCLNLQQESIQYYHRYLALMKLGDFARVARDTARNLRVFDFVQQHGQNEEIKWSFEQYRAYVVMMNVRARASLSLTKSNYKEALKYISEGIEKIERFQKKFVDRLPGEQLELDFLKHWKEEVRSNIPLSKHEMLTEALKEAVRREEYEQAAVLRDKLCALSSTVKDDMSKSRSIRKTQ